MATKRVVHLTDAQWAKIEPLTPRGPDLLLVLESKSLKRLSCESRASHKKPIPTTEHTINDALAAVLRGFPLHTRGCTPYLSS